MTSSLPETFRRYVDGILVINMDSNPARYASLMQAVAGVLPEERIERLSAVVGRELPGCGEAPWFTECTGERAKAWAGVAGCTLSHRKCIAVAKERGWKRVLVLEDDVRPAAAAETAEQLETALAQLSGPYLFHIGHNRPVPHGKRVSQVGGAALWRIDGVLGAHAYIVPEEAYDTLLAGLPTEENIWEWVSRYRAVDTYYREYVGTCGLLPVYSLFPHLFSQAGGVSDIMGTTVAEGNCAAAREPHRAGLCNLLLTPFRRLKIRLNSLRTLRRARRGGLPGKRRRRS